MENSDIFALSRFGDYDGVRAILEKGIDVNIREEQSRRTPLHMAAEHGHEDIAQLLLEHLADIEPRDKYGNTPWDLACRTSYNSSKKLARAARDVADLLSPGQPLLRESEVVAKFTKDTAAEQAEHAMAEAAAKALSSATLGVGGAGDAASASNGQTKRSLGRVEVYASRVHGEEQEIVTQAKFSPRGEIVCDDGTQCPSVQALVDLAMTARSATRNDPKCEKCFRVVRTSGNMSKSLILRFGDSLEQLPDNLSDKLIIDIRCAVHFLESITRAHTATCMQHDVRAYVHDKIVESTARHYYFIAATSMVSVFPWLILQILLLHLCNLWPAYLYDDGIGDLAGLLARIDSDSWACIPVLEVGNIRCLNQHITSFRH